MNLNNDFTNISYILEESIWGGGIDKAKNKFIDEINKKTQSLAGGRIKTHVSYAPTGIAGKLTPSGKKASLDVTGLDGNVFLKLMIYSDGGWVIFQGKTPVHKGVSFKDGAVENAWLETLSHSLE